MQSCFPDKNFISYFLDFLRLFPASSSFLWAMRVHWAIWILFFFGKTEERMEYFASVQIFCMIFAVLTVTGDSLASDEGIWTSLLDPDLFWVYFLNFFRTANSRDDMISFYWDSDLDSIILLFQLFDHSFLYLLLFLYLVQVISIANQKEETHRLGCSWFSTFLQHRLLKFSNNKYLKIQSEFYQIGIYKLKIPVTGLALPVLQMVAML